MHEQKERENKPIPGGKSEMNNALTPAEQLHNLAQCVLSYTEVKRAHNGRGRTKTYAANVDAIAGAARQLAGMVELHLAGK